MCFFFGIINLKQNHLELGKSSICLNKTIIKSLNPKYANPIYQNVMNGKIDLTVFLFQKLGYMID